MSWSIEVCGKPAAVAIEFRKQAQNHTCVQPEEGFKLEVADLVERMLETFPKKSMVKVCASGSQTNYECNEG